MQREFSVSDRFTRLFCGGYRPAESESEAIRGTQIHKELEQFWSFMMIFGEPGGSELGLLSKKLLDDEFGAYQVLDVEGKGSGNYRSILPHKEGQNCFAFETQPGIWFSGKPDLILSTEDHPIVIVDWKSGFHPEYLKVNQLKSYAAMLFHLTQHGEVRFDQVDAKAWERVVENGIMGIFGMIDMQSLRGPYVWKPPELQDELLKIQDEIQQQKSLGLNATRSSCRYCANFSSCPALEPEATAEVFMDEPQKQWEALKDLKLKNKSRQALEKELEELLVQQLQDNSEVLEGVSLKPTRRSTWIEKALLKKSRELGISRRELFEKRLQKMSDLETLLKDRGLDREGIRELKDEKVVSWRLMEEVA
jgi:hypothetical protein